MTDSNPMMGSQSFVDGGGAPPIKSVAPPKKQRIWTPFLLTVVVFFAMIISQVFGVAILMASRVSQGEELADVANSLVDQLTNPDWFIIMGLLGQLCIFFGAVVAARLSPEPFRQRLHLNPTGWSIGKYSLIALATMFPTAIGMSLAHLLTFVIPPDPSVAMLYEKMTIGMSIPFLLFISLAPGFSEEFLFRGYMQNRLVKRLGPGVAITISSIIFGVFHIMPHAIVFATVVGFWLGYVSWKSDSIWPTIVCHAFINGIWNVFNLSSKFLEIPETTQYIILGVCTFIGFIAFVLSLRLLENANNKGKFEDATFST